MIAAYSRGAPNLLGLDQDSGKEFG